MLGASMVEIVLYLKCVATCPYEWTGIMTVGKILMNYTYVKFDYPTVACHIYTVGPWFYPNLHYPKHWLSECYFEFLNPEIWFDFLQNEAINEMPVWFLGLLYHSTMGRKAY